MEKAPIPDDPFDVLRASVEAQLAYAAAWGRLNLLSPGDPARATAEADLEQARERYAQAKKAWEKLARRGP
jgi:hypothetical protein